MKDLYADITNRIVSEIENGALPWLKPWKSGVGATSATALPCNAVSNRAYSGVNVLILWSEAMMHGYSSGRWLTFKQASAAGGHVRKGEKGTAIIFIAKVEKKTKDAKGDDKVERFPLMRTYYVFNVAQCDNLPANITADKPLPPAPELDSRFTTFVDSTGARVRHGGDSAHYSPALDYVAMPVIQAFNSLDSYKATFGHELVHWTGHDSRLKRDFSGRFGSEAYAFEELVAEIGAAFLCATLGVTGELRHASYVGNWLKVLKSDKRAIFTAASAASKAADFLLAFSSAESADDSDDESAALAVAA